MDLHHHDSSNPYFAFTDACNTLRPTVILASGQACVWYRLTLASKDGDWIIRHEPSAIDIVLRRLADIGAQYRLGAPLALPWLAAGWSSHFEATGTDGTRLRFDFVSHPPRLSPERLAACWRDVDAGHAAVVGRTDLIALKRTMRLKDYAFVGALALQLEDPTAQLAATLDAEHVLSLLKAHPGLSSRLSVLRPALAKVALEIEPLAMAIDAEIRTARRADELRLVAYTTAMQEWAQRFRALDLTGRDLLDAHQRIIQAAEGCLPTQVVVSP